MADFDPREEFEGLKRMCVSVQRRLGWARLDPEELFQETAAYVLKGRRIESASHFRALFCVSVEQRAIDCLRRRRRQPDRCNKPCDGCCAPDDGAMSRIDDVDLVDALLRELERNHQSTKANWQAAIMRAMEGLSVNDLAKRLGVSPDNAKQRYHRGIEEMQLVAAKLLSKEHRDAA